MRRGIVISIGILAGIYIGYSMYVFFPQTRNIFIRRSVVGFLPYWLLSKAKIDYSPYISTLTYFGLSVDENGTIVKLTNPQQEDPGWYALHSAKLRTILRNAKRRGVKLSLLIASGDEDAIESMIHRPSQSAENLIRDVLPVMHTYGFSDLNLDIENPRQDASDSAWFTEFVADVKKNLQHANAGTLTIETQASALIKKDLVNPRSIARVADNVVIMAYDYHYQGSYVTGSVAPLNGVDTDAEYDTSTAIYEALTQMPREKIILGVPLYGYEWETLSVFPHSAVIPGTGVTASNARSEILLGKCATCSAQFDPKAQEEHIIFLDGQTGTYHQIFYPDKRAMFAKLSFAEKNNLGGIALWALGYEGNSILDPLKTYK